MKKPERDKVYWKILNAALQLDFKKGHQRWTMSDLSRTAGVTRSLLYYYFGKSRMDILKEAVRLVGEELYGLTEKRLESWEKGEITAAVLSTRQITEGAPHLAAFYFVHRNRPTEFGDALRKLEMQYLKKLARYFPKFDSDDLKAVYGLMFGLVFAPELSEASVHKAVQAVKAISSNTR